MRNAPALRLHAPELAIAAVLGVLSMGFQLVASRILAPHFGSSIVVWAWLISTFLAAFSGGSLAGGWLAAGSARRRGWSIGIAVAAAACLLFDAGLGPWIATAISRRFDGSGLGLPIVCALLFLPPVAALSCLGPVLVARAAERGMRAGLASGLFAAASTAGNIVGVMATAFLLIPAIGSLGLLGLWALGASLTLAVLSWRLREESAQARQALLALLGIAAASGLVLSRAGGFAAPVPPNVPLTVDSVYNQLTIVRRGTVVWMQRTDHGDIASAVDLADPQRQILAYTGVFFAAALMGPPPDRVLQIGLGGGAFNQLFAASWPDATLTSVEIDPAMRDAAIAHMGFTPTSHDIVEIGDGRRYLGDHPGPWNWIVLDAYIHGGQVQPHLRTVEFYREIAHDLAPGGLMIDNLQRTQRLFASDVVTLRAAFPQVVFISVPHSSNVVAIAGNADPASPPLAQQLAAGDAAKLPAPLRANLSFAVIRSRVIAPTDPALNRPAPILTDNFAPAEYLDALPAQ